MGNYFLQKKTYSLDLYILFDEGEFLKGLKLCHWNCWGIFSKMQDIRLVISTPSKGFDIFGVYESYVTVDFKLN